MDDDTIIDTPEGPKRWGDWKKKNPVQVPSRRTKGKDLPNKVKIRTDEGGLRPAARLSRVAIELVEGPCGAGASIMIG